MPNNTGTEVEAGPSQITGEIEITPEMIEAGLDELYSFHISEPENEEMRQAVAAVYSAMEAARRHDRQAD